MTSSASKKDLSLVPKSDDNDLVQKICSGDLVEKDGHYEIPTSIFVPKVDIKLPPLPAVTFSVPGELPNSPLQILKRPEESFSLLALSNYPAIYIPKGEFAELKKYIETAYLSLPQASALESPEMKAYRSRLDALRSAAMQVVDDLFTNPSQENINRSIKVVSSFVYVLMRDPKSYLILAKLSAHDPYTLQHSVGASVNSIILAKKSGVTQHRELLEIGLGGLLHDIGKVRVSKDIINKPGPLDDKEWEEMRTHSAEGFKIIEKVPNLTDVTKRAVLEHHEDKLGKGYPHGLRFDQIHPAAKIVGISDIFNALTTNRSYSKAQTPFEAFRLMKEKLSHKFDPELFRLLVMIYGGKIE